MRLLRAFQRLDPVGSAVHDRPQALFAAKPGRSTGRCDGAAAIDARSDLPALSGFEDTREASR